jgi:hypothetical protein
LSFPLFTAHPPPHSCLVSPDPLYLRYLIRP